MDKETCDQAIVREITEETGLKIKNLEKVFWDTGIEPNKHNEPTNYVFLVYTCENESGQLTTNDDLEKLEWVSIDNLKDYPISIYTRSLFKKLKYL